MYVCLSKIFEDIFGEKYNGKLKANRNIKSLFVGGLFLKGPVPFRTFEGIMCGTQNN